MINREVATFRVVSLSSHLCSDHMFQLSTCKALIYSRVNPEFSVLFECAPITATKAVETPATAFFKQVASRIAPLRIMRSNSIGDSICQRELLQRTSQLGCMSLFVEAGNSSTTGHLADHRPMRWVTVRSDQQFSLCVQGPHRWLCRGRGRTVKPQYELDDTYEVL